MMTSCIMRVSRRRWTASLLSQLLLSQLLLSQLLLIFSCQAVSAQQDSQWLEKPSNQLKPVGGTAQFVCKSPNLNTNIVWTKGTQVLFVNQAKYNPNIPDRYTLTDPYTLTITQVQQSDNDMYGCNVQDFGSASANLTVLLPPGPPAITSDLSGGVFEEGQTVHFTCLSSGGNPPPTVTWMKNGVELLNVAPGQTTTEGSTTRNVLSVTMDHSDHQANYTCFVYNTVNENSPLIAYKILNVRYSPIITFEPFSPYTVRLGRSANITCQVDANPPVNSVTWQKNGNPLPGTNFMRMFSPVVRNHTGNYTCIAYNSLNSNSPTRNTIRVDVVYPPVVSVPVEKNVPESTRLSVTCSVDANPYPYQITWEKVLPNGQRRQKANSENLAFTQITREDAGNYSCKASSLLKVSGVSVPETVYGEAFMYINVQYGPGPASISPVGNIDVGQRLQITCSATPTGYPSARFRWRRNGAEQSLQDATYIIPSTSLSDSAIYSCTPFNSVGEGAPANVSVSINEPPTLLQGLQEEITRTISNTKPLTLTCRGQGRPEPSIEWFKDNMTDSLVTMPQFYFIQSSSRPKNTYSSEVISTLSFKGAGRDVAPSGERVQLRMEDLGNYTCRVRSPVHTRAPASMVQLKVQFAPVVLNPSQKIAVTVSDEARLPCEAQSYPRPVFQWYRNGQQIDMSASKFSEQQMALSGVASGYKSLLVISQVGASDYGLYNCFVSNFLANITSTVNVTTKSTPEAPTSLQTLSRTWESIYLQWTAGFNGGYPQQFQVEYKESGTEDKAVVPGQPLSTTEFNITGLKPSTRYEFSVFGRNRLGLGHHSITITSQTWELEIPTLGDAVPVFHSSSNQLVITAQPSAQYCLKIDARDSEGKWTTIKQCTRLVGGGSLEIVERGIVGINVSVCLVGRPEVCGPPTKAQISQPDSSPTLTVRDVIIIACVCAVIIITLLIILICFICRRRRANAKEYENSGVPPSASNGGIPGKKMHQGQGQPQPYDNAGGRYPTFATSSEHPPNYWDSNPQQQYCDSHNNLSFDSHIDRQMFELELNSRNDMAIYGRADGYRGQQESISMQGRPMSPHKDKYIDLEDRKDPSLQSQESGYSTGDPNKPKKTHHHHQFGFSWRPSYPFSGRRRILTRMRKKQKSQPHPRFSHSPPGHTCGLPCCSEDSEQLLHLRLNAPRYSCMPTPHRQADLENNFTFRRSRLIAGRPTLTDKFYSLQTSRGGAKGRAGLPKFHDDWGIEKGRGDGEREGGSAGGAAAAATAAGADSDYETAASDAARENLRQYRASIETDTDTDTVTEGGGVSEPYVAADSHCSRIRTPVRYLQPWEWFHKREISLPDHPGTPRRMVFLDYRPGESHDGAEEEEEMIEVYSSGFKPSSSSSSSSSSRPKTTSSCATPPYSSSSVTQTPSSSSSSSSAASSLTVIASRATTHASSSSSTQTTSTASPSTASRPRVSYSGAVRPIPAPTVHTALKSALKKPRPKPDPVAGDAGSEDCDKDSRCPVCSSGTPPAGEGHGQGRGQNAEGQGQSVQGQGQGQRMAMRLPALETPSPPPAVFRAGSVVEAAQPDPQPLDDEEEEVSEASLYAEGHVYDVLSDVAPHLLEEKEKNSGSSPDPDLTLKGGGYEKRAAPKPPPVPPTRRNDNPKPDRGRKALTPELKRRFVPDHQALRRNKSEERYSTFPTRRKNHHHYEELTPPVAPPPTTTDQDGSRGGGGGRGGRREPCRDPPEIQNADCLSEECRKGLSLDVLDFYRVDSDKTRLVLDGTVEESLYESLINPAFLSDSWTLSRDQGGGSVGSVDSARLSHASYGSYGCTCLSGDTSAAPSVSPLDDVGKGSDVSARDVSKGDAEGKKVGFLADNPITLIL